jgi:hypothetical protein
VPALFRRCPAYPPGSRRIIDWLLGNRTVLYALTPGVAACGPLIISALVGNSGSKPIDAAQPLSLLPFVEQQMLMAGIGYLLFILPMAGRCWYLVSPSWGGRAITTQDREAILDHSRFPQWLFFFVAALFAGDVLYWLKLRNVPLGTSIVGWIQTTFRLTTSDADVWNFAIIALFAIVVHYFLFVEIPYGVGQRRWKSNESLRVNERLQGAESALRERLFAPIVVGGPSVGENGESTSKLLAEYMLALEDRRKVAEIPLYTVKSLSEALLKLAHSLLVSSIVATLGLENLKGASEFLNSLVPGG